MRFLATTENKKKTKEKFLLGHRLEMVSVYVFNLVMKKCLGMRTLKPRSESEVRCLLYVYGDLTLLQETVPNATERDNWRLAA